MLSDLWRWLDERRHLLADRRVILGLVAVAFVVMLVGRALFVQEPPDEVDEVAEESETAADVGERPTRGGSLRVAMPGQITTLDPHRMTTSSERMVACALTDPLFTFDMSRGVRPGVISEWDVIDEGMAYELHVSPDIEFTDGTPLDAEAVEFNLKRMQELGPAVMVGAWLASIREVEVIDELQLRIDLWYPDPHLPFNLSRPETGLVSPEAGEEKEEGLAFAPAGLGPFTVDWGPEGEELLTEETETDMPEVLTELNLTAYSDYWRGRARLDSLSFVQQDADAEPEQLLADGFDVVAQAPPGYSVSDELGTDLVRPNLDHHILSVNLDRDELQDRDVRAALHHAIDRDRIIERVFSGDADALYIGGYAGDPRARAEDEPDPQRAEQLLAGSGYGEDDDPLQLTLLTDENEDRVAVSRQIADQLKNVGIEVEVEEVPEDEYHDRMRAGEYDISYWVLAPQLPDPLGYTANLRSDSHWNVSQIWRPDEFTSVRDRVDDLLKEVSRATDERDRTEAFQEFAQLAAQEQLYVSLWMTGTRALVGNDVRDIAVCYGFSFCYWRTWLASEE